MSVIAKEIKSAIVISDASSDMLNSSADDKSYGFIYKITNTKNGKMYVGQTSRTIEHRWGKHITTKIKRFLHLAIDKYGVDSFKIEELDRVELDQLNDKERYWIKELNTMAPHGYNLTPGGDGGRGYKHSDKSRRIMSAAKKGKPLSAAARTALDLVLKNSHPRKGAGLSEETKQKIGNANRGRVFTNKQKENMKSKIREAVARPVECYNKDGSKVAEFACTVDAYAWLGKKPSGSIRACCIGETYRKSAYGYIWKFKEVDNVGNS